MMIEVPEIIYAIYNNIVGVIFFGVLIVAGIVSYWQRKRERKTDAEP